jgi:hypothetical protein
MFPTTFTISDRFDPFAMHGPTKTSLDRTALSACGAPTPHA